MGIFKKNQTAKKRPNICLSLPCESIEEIEYEIREHGELAQMIEWRADAYPGISEMEKDEYISLAKTVKKLCGNRKLIVDCGRDDNLSSRIIRWSIGISDMVSMDFSNPQISRIIREAHRKKTEVIASYHDFERMPARDEIAETLLRMEKLGADILKVACIANTENDMYSVLEAASVYSQLKGAKRIVAIAMGEEGQVSRICGGDFGSYISYAAGSKATAPGQFTVEKLSHYMDNYYKTK